MENLKLKIDDVGRVGIPKSLRDKYGIKNNTYLTVIEKEEGFILQAQSQPLMKSRTDYILYDQYVEDIQTKIRPGYQVKLIKLSDDDTIINPGTLGEVEAIDIYGKVIVNWENGLKFCLLRGDEFEIISK